MDLRSFGTADSTTPLSRAEDANPAPAEIFAFAAETRDALIDRLTQVLRIAADLAPRAEPVDAAHAEANELNRVARLHARDRGGVHRAAFVATGFDDLHRQVTQALARFAQQPDAGSLRLHRGVSYGHGAQDGETALVFPGQGSQFPNMLDDLRRRRAQTQRWFDGLDAVYRRAGAPSPRDALGGGEGLFNIGTGAQLGLIASIAMHDALVAMGIRADSYVGHSNGEHAALIAAGRLAFPSIDATCEFIGTVGLESRLLENIDNAEAVIAVSGNCTAAVDALVMQHPGDLYVSVDNCSLQRLLAGKAAVIDEAATRLRAGGAVCSPLPFERAFHTPLFADWPERIWRHYCDLPIRQSSAAVYCCATGSPYPDDPAQVRELLARLWATPVHFRQTIQAMYAAGVRTFIEAGPDGRLVPFIADILRNRPYRAYAASSRNRSDRVQLRHLAASLFADGLSIRWAFFDELDSPTPEAPPLGEAVDGRGALRERAVAEHLQTLALLDDIERRVVHRLSAFGSHYSSSAMGHAAERDATDTVGPPLLGEVRRGRNGSFTALRRHRPDREHYLRDHAFGRPGRGPGSPLPVLPFTGMLAILAEAAGTLFPHTPVTVASPRLYRWLAFDEGSIVLETIGDAEGASVEVFERRADGARHRVATANVIPRDRTAADDDTPVPPESGHAMQWNPARFYREYAFHGPSFQGLAHVVEMTQSHAIAELRCTALPGLAHERLLADPALLDCAGQLVALWLLENGEEKLGAFPYAAGALTIFAAPPPPGSIVVCRASFRRPTVATTEVDVHFCFADGKPLATLLGLQQRLVRFPDHFGDILFGSGPLARSPALPMLQTAAGLDWLSRDGGIWALVVAHACLPTAQWAAWKRQHADSAERAADLRQRLFAETGWQQKAKLSANVITENSINEPME